jgi:hypothetical protein
MTLTVANAVDLVLSALGDEQRGVFTGQQAALRGVPRTALSHRVATDRLVRVHRDIYRLRDHPWNWEARLQAALFDAGPGSAVSYRSAGRLHRMYHYRHSNETEVTRPRGGRHRVELGRLHETRALPPEHVTMIDGFPVTTLARTCFDLAGDPDPDIVGKPWCAEEHRRRVARVLNDALGRRGLLLVHEISVLAAIGKRGRAGTALIRQLLARFGPKYQPTMSDAESLFTELLDAWGIPQPERQVRFGDDELIGILDFFFRPQLLDLEIDSTWHDGPLDSEEDEARDARLRAIGLDVKRFTYGNLVLTPYAVRTWLEERLGLR